MHTDLVQSSLVRENGDMSIITCASYNNQAEVVSGCFTASCGLRRVSTHQT